MSGLHRLSGLWVDFHLTGLIFLAKLVGDSFLPDTDTLFILRGSMSKTLAGHIALETLEVLRMEDIVPMMC